MFSESGDDDNVDSESYIYFEPEIARKIKLCSIFLVLQKMGVP
jgi:hypothetical protein